MSYKIQTDNTGVTTSLFVKDHPDWMWYREAVQNSIEASLSYISQKNLGNAEVEIRTLDVKGLIADEHGNSNWKNKLSFYNLGGMSAPQLIKAVSVGGTNKTASLAHNYGIGIKTAVLNWSDLLIITYKDKIGHFAWLGKEFTNGIDFHIVSFSGDGSNPIEECTDWILENAEYRGYDLNHDFTEVIILGKEVNQNTYLHPFGFGPDGEERKKLAANHIKENITKRYFRLPDNIKIKIAPTANNEKGAHGSHTFITYPEAFSRAESNEKMKDTNGDRPKQETIPTRDGIKIHYYWDGPCGDLYSNPEEPCTANYLNNQYTTAFSGFVWRNEIYDVQENTRRQWKTTAFRLGIQSNAKYFRIFVEYPDKEVLTDKYRTKLQSNYQDLEFDSDSNLSMILSHMPEWYREKTKETKQNLDTNYNDELKKMFSEYMELDRHLIAKPLSGDGVISKERRNPKTPREEIIVPKDISKKGPVQRNAKKFQYNEPAIPNILPATEEQIKEFHIKENFGYFIPMGGVNGTDTLIYNSNYKVIDKIASASISKIDESYFDQAKDLVKSEMILKTALWIMICRSRQNQESMDSADFNSAMRSQNLDTYILSNELDILKNVKLKIEKRFKNDQRILTTTDEDLDSDLESKFVEAGGKLPVEA